ncbi:LOW QUALITY PROTEIN: hypothetical protein CRUP_014050 [Coryphaenoides rupestris]|nr:LOW QUALITY PROTEIN: hypothetical protein CRUP_014050 [Coryphaenoides rupestris]
MSSGAAANQRPPQHCLPGCPWRRSVTSHTRRPISTAEFEFIWALIGRRVGVRLRAPTYEQAGGELVEPGQGGPVPTRGAVEAPPPLETTPVVSSTTLPLTLDALFVVRGLWVLSASNSSSSRSSSTTSSWLAEEVWAEEVCTDTSAASSSSSSILGTAGGQSSSARAALAWTGLMTVPVQSAGRVVERASGQRQAVVMWQQTRGPGTTEYCCSRAVMSVSSAPVGDHLQVIPGPQDSRLSGLRGGGGGGGGGAGELELEASVSELGGGAYRCQSLQVSEMRGGACRYQSLETSSMSKARISRSRSPRLAACSSSGCSIMDRAMRSAAPDVGRHDGLAGALALPLLPQRRYLRSDGQGGGEGLYCLVELRAEVEEDPKARLEVRVVSVVPGGSGGAGCGGVAGREGGGAVEQQQVLVAGVVGQPAVQGVAGVALQARVGEAHRQRHQGRQMAASSRSTAVLRSPSLARSWPSLKALGTSRGTTSTVTVTPPHRHATPPPPSPPRYTSTTATLHLYLRHRHATPPPPSPPRYTSTSVTSTSVTATLHLHLREDLLAGKYIIIISSSSSSSSGPRGESVLKGMETADSQGTEERGTSSMSKARISRSRSPRLAACSSSGCSIMDRAMRSAAQMLADMTGWLARWLCRCCRNAVRKLLAASLAREYASTASSLRSPLASVAPRRFHSRSDGQGGGEGLYCLVELRAEVEEDPKARLEVRVVSVVPGGSGGAGCGGVAGREGGGAVEQQQVLVAGVVGQPAVQGVAGVALQARVGEAHRQRHQGRQMAASSRSTAVLRSPSLARSWPSLKALGTSRGTTSTVTVTPPHRHATPPPPSPPRYTSTTATLHLYLRHRHATPPPPPRYTSTSVTATLHLHLRHRHATPRPPSPPPPSPPRYTDTSATLHRHLRHATTPPSSPPRYTLTSVTATLHLHLRHRHTTPLSPPCYTFTSVTATLHLHHRHATP